MNYNQLKKRKDLFFTRIMSDKYNKKETPATLIKEYRFLQREEKRMIKNYNKSA